MAELNNCKEPALPTKRNPDPSFRDPPKDLKKQKIHDPDDSALPRPDPKADGNGAAELEPQADSRIRKNDVVEEEKGEVEDEEDYNGKAVIDRKGKGILVEEDEESEDEDDDDEDSSADDGVSDGDSDLSEDPLTEVDLDNILPSRTRRRAFHPGAYIANDLAADDDSDDPDA